jgi:hypothetical protein
MAQSSLFHKVTNDFELRRKCLGIAKNYFTDALKKDKSAVKLPEYPWIFNKPMSRYIIFFISI